MAPAYGSHFLLFKAVVNICGSSDILRDLPVLPDCKLTFLGVDEQSRGLLKIVIAHSTWLL